MPVSATRMYGRDCAQFKSPPPPDRLRARHGEGVIEMPQANRIVILAFLVLAAPALAADKIRLAVLKTGSVAWELDIIRARGLDKAAGLDIETTELASPEAGKIALRGGAADIIVSDWLWVSRERSLGTDLVFYPYSSAIGAVMAPGNSAIATLGDLRGRKLAVAGGAIDKSWLMLQAHARKSGFDIKNDSLPMFGAPPLLAQKTIEGEAEASLNFWNFCADLEARGFKTVLGMDEVEKALGAKGPVAMLGYVFSAGYAAKNAGPVARFLKIAREAKELLATSDADWQTLGPRIGAKDAAAQAIYRRRYAEGIPRRPVAEEEADAQILFKVLAETGGTELVGAARVLDPGTFYKAIPGS